MKPATKRQRDILKAIAKLNNELERPPTVKELAAHIKVSRQNTRQHVWRLKDKGLVNFKAQDRQALTPVLTDKAKALLGDTGYAVLGSIAAGQPIHASDRLEAYTDSLSELIPMQEGDFLLKIDGDSMIGAGYFPNDFVIVRPSNDVLDGEIAVAFLPDQETATLKRWYKQKNEVLLVAENPRYEPIRLAINQVSVQGVVVGHVGFRRQRRSLQDVLSDAQPEPES